MHPCAMTCRTALLVAFEQQEAAGVLELETARVIHDLLRSAIVLVALEIADGSDYVGHLLGRWLLQPGRVRSEMADDLVGQLASILPAVHTIVEPTPSKVERHDPQRERFGIGAITHRIDRRGVDRRRVDRRRISARVAAAEQQKNSENRRNRPCEPAHTLTLHVLDPSLVIRGGASLAQWTPLTVSRSRRSG
jgi:hypothetical protein